MDHKVNIYLFHRVAPARDPLWNPISPYLFEKIISYLSKNYEIVPLEPTLLNEYKPTGRKPLCAITFDDGYKDYIDYALPILRKYNAPSSMYIITDCADRDVPPWTFVLNHLFINTSHLSLSLASKALPPALRKTTWKNSSERIQYASKLAPFIKQLNNQERKLIYEQILFDFNDVDMPLRMMMNWDEIREAKNNGCEIGSHSKSHPLLTKKISQESLSDEIVASGKKIELHTGTFPRTFSYPFGNYNRQTEEAIAEAGYKIGIAVNNKTFYSKRNSLFEVPRIELYDEPFYKSLLRIAGVLPRANRILRRERKF